jgi:L-malate glycosyltransferase
MNDLNVALLMGNRLSAWHTAQYCDLPGVAVEAFTTTDALYSLKDMKLPYQTLPLENEVGSWLARKKKNLTYRKQHKNGFEFSAAGLEEIIAKKDLVHTWELYTPWTQQALDAKKNGGPQVLITVWDNIAHNHEKLPIEKEVKERARNEADGFLVYTEGSRNALIKELVPEAKIHKVHPAIDSTLFCPGESRVRKQLAIKDNEVVVLFVGRLVKSKGVHLLLEVFERIVKQLGEIKARLIIVGSGPERESMTEMVSKGDLVQRVRFAGSRAYKELSGYYQAADIMVLPSQPTPEWEEQFGMCLLEAMACGVPVLASNSGGISEIVGDAATLVEPTDERAWLDQLLNLIQSRTTRESLAEKGKKRAAENFSLQTAQKKITEIYRKISGKE